MQSFLLQENEWIGEWDDGKMGGWGGGVGGQHKKSIRMIVMRDFRFRRRSFFRSNTDSCCFWYLIYWITTDLTPSFCPTPSFLWAVSSRRAGHQYWMIEWLASPSICWSDCPLYWSGCGDDFNSRCRMTTRIFGMSFGDGDSPGIRSLFGDD